jgi:GGDEF domain-containing protein
MEQLSRAVLARLTVDEFRRCVPELSKAAAADLLHRIATALGTAVRQEREACAGLCRERQALWASTEERPGTPAPLRQEARARSNEAAWLGDAIRARET